MEWPELIRNEMAWRWAYVAVASIVAVLTSRAVYTSIRECAGNDVECDDVDRGVSLMIGFAAGLLWGVLLPFVAIALIGEVILPARAKGKP